MILFFTLSEEGLILSVWDLSTERGKVRRPFGAVSSVVICASDEGKAGSDKEGDSEVRAEGFDGASASIAAYLSSWGLIWN